MSYTEIGLHAQSVDTNLGSMVNTIRRGSFVHLERELILTLTSHDFCISTLNLKLEMTIFIICHYKP